MFSCCKRPPKKNTLTTIDRQLEISGLHTKLKFKILLLGAGESGKVCFLQFLFRFLLNLYFLIRWVFLIIDAPISSWLNIVNIVETAQTLSQNSLNITGNQRLLLLIEEKFFGEYVSHSR